MPLFSGHGTVITACVEVADGAVHSLCIRSNDDVELMLYRPAMPSGRGSAFRRAIHDISLPHRSYILLNMASAGVGDWRAVWRCCAVQYTSEDCTARWLTDWPTGGQCPGAVIAPDTERTTTTLYMTRPCPATHRQL